MSKKIDIRLVPYCGAREPPKNRVRGTSEQCINAGQARYYGIMQVENQINKILAEKKKLANEKAKMKRQEAKKKVDDANKKIKQANVAVKEANKAKQEAKNAEKEAKNQQLKNQQLIILQLKNQQLIILQLKNLEEDFEKITTHSQI